MSGPNSEPDDEDEFKPVQLMVRVSNPGDPERCAATMKHGSEQCWFVRNPGSRHCRMHGGQIETNTLKKKALKLYDVAKYRDRLDRLQGAQDIGARLTEELAILRMSLEAILSKGDEVELSNNSARICLIVREIRETLKGDQAQKKALGELLDKAAISKICDSMISIIQKYVTAEHLPQVIDEVATVLADAVAGATK